MEPTSAGMRGRLTTEQQKSGGEEREKGAERTGRRVDVWFLYLFTSDDKLARSYRCANSSFRLSFRLKTMSRVIGGFLSVVQESRIA